MRSAEHTPAVRARLAGAIVLGLLVAAPVSAQSRQGGYIAVSGGAQTTTRSFTDRFVYIANAEEATTEARYPSKEGVAFDVGAGMRVWRSIGAGLHATRSSIGGSAQTDSQIPHPFVDDQDRLVSGEARDLARSETAAHVQLYYLRQFGNWQLRLGAGPSYFTLTQEVVTGVTLQEEYPYDTAAFSSATTKRSRESAVGFNVGADVGWMFTRRFGAGGLVRFSRAKMNLDVDTGHRFSTDAGGVQAAGGIRLTF